ncbi:MAG: sigma-70 family RNA polymerase sigma factor [Chitinophagaceae bacterium]|nr:sigma-70 family RNA polymerase sigma factor [Chitinophagaceae bacterium]MCW5904737.1 sigma-70 family RNA polymerase sigma factor [Chitinophagaceae bacterium]
MHNEKYTHITDNELLNFYYNSHENKWLGILLERYTLLLLGTCMKYLKNEEEAKDAVQQIFLKAITELKKYKVDYFKSWLYIMARNHCLMLLRNKNITIQQPENLLIETEETNIEQFIQQEQTLTSLENAVEALNDEQKICIKLFYLQKKSYQQITNITGFSLLQVKSYIQNGKRNLKLIIQKNMPTNT